MNWHERYPHGYLAERIPCGDSLILVHFTNLVESTCLCVGLYAATIYMYQWCIKQRGSEWFHLVSCMPTTWLQVLRCIIYLVGRTAQLLQYVAQIFICSTHFIKKLEGRLLNTLNHSLWPPTDSATSKKFRPCGRDCVSGICQRAPLIVTLKKVCPEVFGGVRSNTSILVVCCVYVVALYVMCTMIKNTRRYVNMRGATSSLSRLRHHNILLVIARASCLN